jgi:hypothetical protein
MQAKGLHHPEADVFAEMPVVCCCNRKVPGARIKALRMTSKDPWSLTSRCAQSGALSVFFLA